MVTMNITQSIRLVLLALYDILQNLENAKDELRPALSPLHI